MTSRSHNDLTATAVTKTTRSKSLEAGRNNSCILPRPVCKNVVGSQNFREALLSSSARHQASLQNSAQSGKKSHKGSNSFIPQAQSRIPQVTRGFTPNDSSVQSLAHNPTRGAFIVPKQSAIPYYPAAGAPQGALPAGMGPKGRSSDGESGSGPSAAASFFARAALRISESSRHKKKQKTPKKDAVMTSPVYQDVTSLFPTNFSSILARNPPPVPPTLCVPTAGSAFVPSKVHVVLRICPLEGNSMSSPSPSNSSLFSVDMARRQVIISDPADSGYAVSSAHKGPLPPKMFAFDSIIGPTDPLSSVCSESLVDILQAVIGGADGCLFNYGHARLGKTFTMMGVDDSPHNLGVIPCAISWLFQLIGSEKERTGARFSVRVSAVEVTGRDEILKDLLADVAKSTDHGTLGPGVYLRDDPVCGTQLENQSELRAPTPEHAAYYLDAAIAARTVPEVEEDARNSHMLFTLHVYQYRLETSNNGESGVTGGRSRLHLIDFGSCHRGRTTGGSALSLSALGTVIMALLNGQRHVPYRESKLAQLVKESLSGATCRACMIVHVSSTPQSYNETLPVVQLASRLHRMKQRRRVKFAGGTSSDESSSCSGSARSLRSAGRRCGVRMGTLREYNMADYTSSSEQSCDTAIYMGDNTSDITDGEGPPTSPRNLPSHYSQLRMNPPRFKAGISPRLASVSEDEHIASVSDCGAGTSGPFGRRGLNYLSDGSHRQINAPKRRTNGGSFLNRLMGEGRLRNSLSQGKSSQDGSGIPHSRFGGRSLLQRMSFSRSRNFSAGNAEEHWIDGPKSPQHQEEQWIDGPKDLASVTSRQSPMRSVTSPTHSTESGSFCSSTSVNSPVFQGVMNSPGSINSPVHYNGSINSPVHQGVMNSNVSIHSPVNNSRPINSPVYNGNNLPGQNNSQISSPVDSNQAINSPVYAINSSSNHNLSINLPVHNNRSINIPVQNEAMAYAPIQNCTINTSAENTRPNPSLHTDAGRNRNENLPSRPGVNAASSTLEYIQNSCPSNSQKSNGNVKAYECKSENNTNSSKIQTLSSVPSCRMIPSRQTKTAENRTLDRGGVATIKDLRPEGHGNDLRVAEWVHSVQKASTAKLVGLKREIENHQPGDSDLESIKNFNIISNEKKSNAEFLELEKENINVDVYQIVSDQRKLNSDLCEPISPTLSLSDFPAELYPEMKISEISSSLNNSKLENRTGGNFPNLNVAPSDIIKSLAVDTPADFLRNPERRMRLDVAALLLANRESIYELKLDEDLDCGSRESLQRLIYASSDDESVWNTGPRNKKPNKSNNEKTSNVEALEQSNDLTPGLLNEAAVNQIESFISDTNGSVNFESLVNLNTHSYNRINVASVQERNSDFRVKTRLDTNVDKIQTTHDVENNVIKKNDATCEEVIENSVCSNNSVSITDSAEAQSTLNNSEGKTISAINDYGANSSPKISSPCENGNLLPTSPPAEVVRHDNANTPAKKPPPPVPLRANSSLTGSRNTLATTASEIPRCSLKTFGKKQDHNSSEIAKNHLNGEVVNKNDQCEGEGNCITLNDSNDSRIDELNQISDDLNQSCSINSKPSVNDTNSNAKPSKLAKPTAVCRRTRIAVLTSRKDDQRTASYDKNLDRPSPVRSSPIRTSSSKLLNSTFTKASEPQLTYNKSSHCETNCRESNLSENNRNLSILEAPSTTSDCQNSASIGVATNLPLNSNFTQSSNSVSNGVTTSPSLNSAFSPHSPITNISSPGSSASGATKQAPISGAGLIMIDGKLLSPYHLVTEPRAVAPGCTSDTSSALSSSVASPRAGGRVGSELEMSSSGYESMICREEGGGASEGEGVRQVGVRIRGIKLLRKKVKGRSRSAPTRSRRRDNSLCLAGTRAPYLAPQRVLARSRHAEIENIPEVSTLTSTHTGTDTDRKTRWRQREAEFQQLCDRRTRIQELLNHQERLKKELQHSLTLLMVDPTGWNFDLRVSDSIHPDDVGNLTALERETAILERRLQAYKSRIMFVTCFDITP